MEIFIFLIALILIFYAWYYNKYHEMHKLSEQFPGPPALPILGNALLFLGKSPPQIRETLIQVVEKYGRTVRIMIGPQVQLLFGDPKDVETILSSQKLIDKADDYDFISKWLGFGLLISTGQKWFTRRKVITPAFHFKILEQFVDVFDKHSAILVKNFAKFKGQECDVFPLVTLCALDVICETSMGVEINAQINSDSVYVKAVKDITTLMSRRLFDVLVRNEFYFNISGWKSCQDKILKILHGFTDSVIIARRAELTSKMKNQQIEADEDDLGIKKKLALLDVLLQSTINGQPLSNLDIREEVDTFMFEGHDTTTSGISFCLYNLAKYPEVQQKAFDEIRSVIGDDINKAITHKDLNELHYLDLVIKESLRLYPSVPLYGRKIKENVEINGKMVPKGCNIGICPGIMARDETLWKDALSFIPERFAVDSIQMHPYANVPFSAGPRNCIGQKFAMLELKSTISKTLRNFELSVAPGFEPIIISELILRPENGIVLVMKDRKY